MSGHGHSHAPITAGGRHRKPLWFAFGLTATFMIVEFIVGFATSSLALLSDAAHMGTDVLGLGMALAAITVAQMSGSPQRTFGTYRLEVLAALANGVLLFAVAGYVLYSAVRRIGSPPEVPGLPLLIVAVLGLVVNLISFRLLSAGAKESLNVRGAYLEVVSDMLGSIGVIVAAVIITTTGWRYADAIIGAAIGLFILPRTYVLMKHAIRILLEAAPAGIKVTTVHEKLAALDGVVEIHDLHVWTITSGMDAASGHVVVAPDANSHSVLDKVTTVMAEEFGIDHITMQCEPTTHNHTDLRH